MINPEQQLQFDVCTPEKLELRAVRDGFGQGLVELAGYDERVVVLCADVAESTRVQAFRERFPDRYIEVGVAEQNMAGIASGLAASGKRPFIVSYAVFSPGRNWEQIRTTIALNDVPVVIVGMHAGVSVGEDGATHQALEDITLMRVLPNMRVIVPADAEEARKAVHVSVAQAQPTYLRCARERTPLFTTDLSPFSIGVAEYLYLPEDPDVVLIGAGPILHDAILVACALGTRGVRASVLNVHSIKPMDISRVLEALQHAGAAVTLEDHQILGGLGSTIAEIAVQNRPVPIEMVAVHDRFGQSGKPHELRGEYRLDRAAIEQAVHRVLERKRSL